MTEVQISDTIRFDLESLVLALQDDILDEYRASDDPEDTTPGISLTVGFSDDGTSYAWQSGDNSYSGAAYGMPYWSVVAIYRDSDAMEIVDEICDQFYDQFGW